MFRRTNGPDGRELDDLFNTISKRVAGYLERQGILERDEENSYLQLDHLQEDPMQQLIGHSVPYRVACCSHQLNPQHTLADYSC